MQTPKRALYCFDILVDRVFFTCHVDVVDVFGRQKVLTCLELLIVRCGFAAERPGDGSELQRKCSWSVFRACAWLKALQAVLRFVVRREAGSVLSIVADPGGSVKHAIRSFPPGALASSLYVSPM